MGLRDAAANGVTAVCVLPGSANVIGGEGVVIHTYGSVVDEMVILPGCRPKGGFRRKPKAGLPRAEEDAYYSDGDRRHFEEQLVKAGNYMTK